MSLASLPMYDWPEEHAVSDALYARLRAQRLDDMLPQALTRPSDAHHHWRDPALVFSQTCWGPLVHAGLIDVLEPIAQPDYGDVPGGQGPFYRSALVARTGLAVTPPRHDDADLPDLAATARLAINEPASLSGCLALAGDLGVAPAALLARAVLSGSHRDSVRAVAQGQADLAAIDCRSWALALCHEPCARDLVVVGWTARRMGLPYVTRRGGDPGQRARLSKALVNMGCHRVAKGEGI